MKASLVVTLVAGASAGALAAVALSPMLAPAVPPAGGGALRPALAAPGADEDLVHVLDALGAQNVELLGRVADLEDRVAAGELARRSVAEAPESAARSDDAHELAAALDDPSAPLPPRLLDGVTNALETIRANEERERNERRQAAYQERLDEMMGPLALELGLTSDQSRRLRTHLESYATRRTELFEGARTGGYQNMRQAYRDLREESQAELAQILDPVQLEKYRELEAERGFDRSWGRGRERDDG